MADVKNGTSRGVDEGSINSYAPATTTSNHTLGVVIDAIIEPKRTEPHPKSRMKKVPLTMRNNKKNKGYFGTRVVSIGPYHHGTEKLQEVKKIKPIVVQLFISSSGIDMNEFCKKLLEIVDDARSSYLEGSTDKYSKEEEFAEKMFFDGLFVSVVIEFRDPKVDRPINDELVKRFGYYVVYLLSNDASYLLENQLPFQFLELLSKNYKMTEMVDKLLIDWSLRNQSDKIMKNPG